MSLKDFASPVNKGTGEINIKCIKCGKTIKSFTTIKCPVCGFDLNKHEFYIICKNEKDLFKDMLLNQNKREMDVFYEIGGHIYTYEEASRKRYFNPIKHKKIVRYLNNDGSMSNEEPSNEEIRKWLWNN